MCKWNGSIGPLGEYCPRCMSIEFTRVTRRMNEAIEACCAALENLEKNRGNVNPGVVADAYDSIEAACRMAASIALPEQMNENGVYK